MDLSKIPLFSLMAKRMGWLSQRHEVLARNIANADTPGYRPYDLSETDFRQTLSGLHKSLRLAVTDPGHFKGLQAVSGSGGDGKARVQKEVYETSLSGNAVILEEQLMKVGETAMNYRLVTNLYRKQVGLLKIAIGRGGTGR